MIDLFLNPKSIAVVGAADDTRKLRGKLLMLLKNSAFDGPIYPVHPKGGTIQDLPAVTSLKDIPGEVDLVYIAAPGSAVPAIISEAVEKGIKAAVILSSGVDQAALDKAVGDSGLRYFGPNTEGYFKDGGVAATFAAVVEHALEEGDAQPRPGKPASIVSQSGGLGFALYGRARAENIDFNAVITTGNEGNIECLDVVDDLLERGESSAIALLIEGFHCPQRFAATASMAADKGVPLIVLKVGQSEAGQRAAVSHTAHLAGADTSYDAVFQRYGIIRVSDMEEMLASIAAFSRFKIRPVRKIGVVSTSGGAGVWAADACGVLDIDVPLLSDALQARLAPVVPEFGSTANPVDVTAQAVQDGGKMLLHVLSELQGSDEIDAIIVNLGLSMPGRITSLEEVLKPLVLNASKPVLFHSHILPIDENLSAIAALGGQGFKTLRGTSLALKALDKYAAFQARWAKTEPPQAPAKPTLSAAPGTTLTEIECSKLLGDYAVPTPRMELVKTGGDAHKAATDFANPVVMKIQSPDIPHKTEAGGVALNVAADKAANTFDEIIRNAAAFDGTASIDGVLVQEMMPKGREFAIGIMRDPDFGPLLMFGMGGIYLEVLKDVVFTPAPVSASEAERLILSLKAAPVLLGTRGEKPSDIKALAALISKVSQLAQSEPSIDQLDLNPVFVYPEGEGVMVVDALAVTGDGS